MFRKINVAMALCGLCLGQAAQAQSVVPVRELPIGADYCSILTALTSREVGECRPALDTGQTRGFGAGILKLIGPPGDEDATDETESADASDAQQIPSQTGRPRQSARVDHTRIAADDAIGAGGYFIQFGFDSTDIDEDYRAHLARLAEVLRQPELAGTCLLLIGHTDSVGSDSYNDALSMRRAKVVRDVLVLHERIPDQRVAADGRGETSLLPGIEGFSARNRRVEVLSREGADECASS